MGAFYGNKNRLTSFFVHVVGRPRREAGISQEGVGVAGESSLD